MIDTDACTMSLSRLINKVSGIPNVLDFVIEIRKMPFFEQLRVKSSYRNPL